MSDTPRTDAQKFGASCAEDFCRVLERENAALREEIKEVKKGFAPTFVAELHAECVKLERENAALRGLLQDSLEWLDDYGMRMSGTSNLVSRIETALRKEAQP